MLLSRSLSDSGRTWLLIISPGIEIAAIRKLYEMLTINVLVQNLCSPTLVRRLYDVTDFVRNNYLLRFLRFNLLTDSTVKWRLVNYS